MGERGETRGLINPRRRNAWHCHLDGVKPSTFRHFHHNPADLLRVDVLQDPLPGTPVEACGVSIWSLGLSAHWVKVTVGTVETSPLRLSLKSCLYSPRLIFMRHTFHEVQAVKLVRAAQFRRIAVVSEFPGSG